MHLLLLSKNNIEKNIKKTHLRFKAGCIERFKEIKLSHVSSLLNI